MVQKGQIVQSIRGRDKGSYLVVLEVTNQRLLTVDGVKRKRANPKPKNAKHVRALRQFIDFAEDGAYDDKVAYLLKQLKTEEQGFVKR